MFQHTLEFFRFSLTSWFDIDKASVLYFFYPVVGIVIATLFVRYVVRDDISEGVTRVLYAMKQERLAHQASQLLLVSQVASRYSITTQLILR